MDVTSGNQPGQVALDYGEAAVTQSTALLEPHPAAGAVVFCDVPPNCIAAGNPAKIIRTEIIVGKFGRLSGADDNSRRLWRP